ncbi:unnamed protein product [Pocillopora meandrina]|uniref:Uncharacterized protein n=1 Tax=Pocillopora meandrina TaxID=46732 RepID=A0AAU9Y275_9CNID|nr:unnamed protein product [Pocillopora meandrina]
MNSGPVLGFSVAPYTIDRYATALRREYPSQLAEKVKEAINGEIFMLLLLDDIHNIHTEQMPESNLKMLGTHMTSSLLDIQDSIQAPKLPENKDIVPLISTTKVCISGISVENIKIIVKRMKE